MELLFWVIVITWMINRTVVDGLYALQGKPSPRHELAKAKLTAAGQPTPVPARYGTRQWWNDLYSDALQANTRWRRGRWPVNPTVIEGRIDDLADAVREPATTPPTTPTTPTEPFAPEWLTDKAGTPQWMTSVVHTDEHPYCVTSCGPTCPAGWGSFGSCRPADSGAEEADRPAAPVIPLFPNLQEVAMSNGTDVNGLAASIAFAEAAAKAHESFAAAGSEGYTGALAQYEVGDGAIASAREAQEASQIAAAKWAAHLADLTKQTVVKEAYQSVPDAGNKTYLLNG